MSDPVAHALLMIAVIAAATVVTRAAPFVLLPKNRPLSPSIAYLGKVLPSAVMALLVVYCLKDIHPLSAPHGLPELLSVAAVAALHAWKRSVLLSVAGGTLLYMVLIQAVFA